MLLVGISVVIMLIICAGLILFFGISHSKYQYYQFHIQEVDLSLHEKLLQQNISSQETEKERIAKEIHDELSSKMNVLHLHLHQLIKKTPEAKANIERMLNVLKEMIDSSRRLSRELLPPTLESFGLTSTLEEFGEKLNKTKKVKIFCNFVGTRPKHITRTIEINLFRLVEFLTDFTLKHSKASWIKIKLWQSEEKLVMHYSDNGKGADQHLQPVSEPLGCALKYIDSSLIMIQGTYTLNAPTGEGLHLELEVPIEPVTPKISKNDTRSNH
ncbi:MAG: histidine kinase [Bacteroidota bacterium]